MFIKRKEQKTFLGYFSVERKEPDTLLTKYLSVSPFFKGVDVVQLELKYFRKTFGSHKKFGLSQKINIICCYTFAREKKKNITEN